MTDVDGAGDTEEPDVVDNITESHIPGGFIL